MSDNKNERPSGEGAVDAFDRDCCELRDPNGTIWEYAEELRKERDAFVRLLDPDGNVVSAMVRLQGMLREIRKGV